jgi:(1->4)-alpha-D-glucan 1-alpha-D-glucosylmutase
LRTVLEDDGTFARELDAFVATVGPAAALAGLVQVFLRLITPGVPDLYQGCEFWDLSLVDPDNRRAVDYAARRVDADALRTPLPQLLPAWFDGRVKQALIARLNAHRNAHAEFYSSAGYTPLTASGPAAAHVIAFERRTGGARLVAIASRWPLSLAREALVLPVIPEAAWQETVVAVPDATDLHDVLHDRAAPIVDSALRLDAVLRDFPLALYFTRTAEN